MLNVRLKYLRKSENKTQQDVADMLGITRPAYTAYEQGKRSPDYTLLEKLADYYNVTTDYLLGRTDTLNISDTLSQAEKDEAEFQAFANDPTLGKWYKELPQSREEDLQRLRKMWEILKDSGEL